MMESTSRAQTSLIELRPGQLDLRELTHDPHPERSELRHGVQPTVGERIFHMRRHFGKNSPRHQTITRLSEDFKSDVPAGESNPDYVAINERTLAMFHSMMAGEIPDAATVAGRIFDAVTDGTDRLRYAVTEGGLEMEEARRGITDQEHVAHMRSMFMAPTTKPV